jgi:uncharacterized membrane protein
MFFLPVGCILGLLFFLALPVIFFIIFFNLVNFSFSQLGMSPEIAMLVLITTLFGSLINIPLTKRKVTYVDSSAFFGFFRIRRAQATGLAINLGGAIVPICVSAYLLTRVPSLWQVLVATILIAIFTKLLARPVPGVGIVLPIFIPPILATIFALILAYQFAAPCAYIAGTIGTLIGADILNLHKLQKLRGVASIGGAGVFDGIFLVGIISVLLTALF